MQAPIPQTTTPKTISVILHDIRSSENVGSIFRTADAAGVSKIYLSGYTPSPLDRFKRKNPKLAKTALGAEDAVPWEVEVDIFSLIENLKKQDVEVFAVEQDPASVPYTNVVSEKKVAYILGNEVSGIPKEVLAACDQIVEIPMRGKKESLNVSVTAGIILFRARDF